MSTFKKGDTVYDTWNQEYEVVGLFPSAEHGIGKIAIRRKKDGVVMSQSVIAHDLTHQRK